MAARKTTTAAAKSAANAAPAHAHKSRTTPPRNWRRAFLAELAVDGNRRRAAEVAGVDSATIYRHRAADAEFRAAWDAAIDHAGEYLEAEAWRRATEGVEEPLTSAKGLLYHADGTPAVVRKYSDSLMALLLKAARPDKYREMRQHTIAARVVDEHTGPGGGPIPVRFFDAGSVLAAITAGSGEDRGGAADE